MELSHQDVQALRQLEESLWQAEVRFSIEDMEGILAPDFFEFGRSGRTYDRQTILESETYEIKAVLPLPDFRVRLLGPDVAQVTYNSIVDYPTGIEYGRRSSIWSRDNGKWKLRFHQGTPFHP